MKPIYRFDPVSRISWLEFDGKPASYPKRVYLFYYLQVEKRQEKEN